MSKVEALAELKKKIAELKTTAMPRHSEPRGTHLDLQSQVKGRLPLENVDVDSIVEVLESVLKALEAA
jgi:hypothetical protein